MKNYRYEIFIEGFLLEQDYYFDSGLETKENVIYFFNRDQKKIKRAAENKISFGFGIWKNVEDENHNGGDEVLSVSSGDELIFDKNGYLILKTSRVISPKLILGIS